MSLQLFPGPTFLCYPESVCSPLGSVLLEVLGGGGRLCPVTVRNLMSHSFGVSLRGKSMKHSIRGESTPPPQPAHSQSLSETGHGSWLSLPSLFTDSHEDHACSYVQAPHRPGDPAVHLGTPSLAMEQGHQAYPPGPRGARSQDKALTSDP